MTTRKLTKAQGAAAASLIRTYTTARISIAEWAMKPSDVARATYTEYAYWRGVEIDARAGLENLGITLP